MNSSSNVSISNSSNAQCVPFSTSLTQHRSAAFPVCSVAPSITLAAIPGTASTGTQSIAAPPRFVMEPAVSQEGSVGSMTIPSVARISDFPNHLPKYGEFPNNHILPTMSTRAIDAASLGVPDWRVFNVKGISSSFDKHSSSFTVADTASLSTASKSSSPCLSGALPLLIPRSSNSSAMKTAFRENYRCPLKISTSAPAAQEFVTYSPSALSPPPPRGERQEPQGEEAFLDSRHTYEEGNRLLRRQLFSNDNHISNSNVNSNTLVIRRNAAIDGYSSQFYGDLSHAAFIGSGNPASPGVLSSLNTAQVASGLWHVGNGTVSVSGQGLLNERVVSSPATPYANGTLPPFTENLISAMPAASAEAATSVRVDMTSLSPVAACSSRRPPIPANELSNIPKHYLDSSTMLKHLAKEIQVQSSRSSSFANLPASVESEGNSNFAATPSTQINDLSIRSAERDLLRERVIDIQARRTDMNCLKLNSLRQEQGNDICRESTQDANHNSTETILTFLTQENHALKAELDICRAKAARLESMDIELQKLQAEQADLVRTTERRENIELALRKCLADEVVRLRAGTKGSRSASVERSGDIMHREQLIAQLLAKNKDLASGNERKDVELAAQAATLNEQRKHIEILDRALTNAQANIVRLEEEARKKEFYEERVRDLQGVLQRVQASIDRRVEMEKCFRANLTDELENHRAHHSRALPGSCCSPDVVQLRKTLREYEEMIVALEAQVAHWECKHLQKSSLCHFAFDSASLPKDVQMARFEHNHTDTNPTLVHVPASELQPLGRLHAAECALAEMEARLKDAQSRLAERDAMIRVLQQRNTLHARAASSVALTHHRRANSKDETSSDRAVIDESSKEFGSHLTNKISATAGAGARVDSDSPPEPSPNHSSMSSSASRSNANSTCLPAEYPSAAENLAITRLSISTASAPSSPEVRNATPPATVGPLLEKDMLRQGPDDDSAVKVWCV